VREVIYCWLGCSALVIRVIAAQQSVAEMRGNIINFQIKHSICKLQLGVEDF